ncbi:hypothetical protein [Paludisphaera borealis]|uniref:Uncharacterized protein n=1 Tax=Paludisphaera borealis TaxID=1387353 RepID=A0A1U7CI84_9BACT|nr:hypothetical protein [Paludisphaera borealis]APW58617.1 hypothetical protein BSF38_00015 [Paludisphaera borealis]
MNHDKATLQQVIDYCETRRGEVREEIAKSPVQDIDILTGRKLAYNDLLQHARTLLNEAA